MIPVSRGPEPAMLPKEPSQTEQEQQRRLSEMLLLNRVMLPAASERPLTEILESVCAELAQVLAVPQVLVAVVNEDQTLLITAEHCAPGTPSALGAVISAENRATQWTLENRKSLAILDVQNDTRQAVINDLSRNSVVHGQDGRPVLLVASGVDIAERAMRERELRQ